MTVAHAEKTRSVAKDRRATKEKAGQTIGWPGLVVSVPVVIETPDQLKPWGVSLGGYNPATELYFACESEDSAWRLHDAILMLIMKMNPSLAGHAISAARSQTLLDQMSRRAVQWSESGTLQVIPCAARTGS